MVKLNPNSEALSLQNGCGCTSGHMLCGLSRLSPRSLISTALFFTTALITANVVGGGSRIPSCGDLPCYTAVYPSPAETAFMAGSLVLSTILNSIVVPNFLERKSEHRSIFAYLAGLEFGLGLWISGMADSAKVLRFFAIATDPSRWDPSLALIILFGIGPSLITFLSKQPGQQSEKDDEPIPPTLAEKWRLPTKTVADIDWRFLAGSIAFGIAWGLQGVCPGPAILRSLIQPTWGLVTMAGYALGNLL